MHHPVNFTGQRTVLKCIIFLCVLPYCTPYYIDIGVNQKPKSNDNNGNVNAYQHLINFMTSITKYNQRYNACKISLNFDSIVANSSKVPNAARGNE